MTRAKISAVIPAYNECASIGRVVAQCRLFCDKIIVVDDGSTDETARIARENGATVVSHNDNLGVVEAIRTGFKTALGDIIVTLDGDGQHDPSDIPRLVQPLIEGKADLALGVRDRNSSFSEKVINLLTNMSVKCTDVSTGFRAVKGNLARRMNPHGTCLCGTFVLEAHKYNAQIVEVPIRVMPRIHSRSRVRTLHIRQFFYVFYDLLRLCCRFEKEKKN